MPAVPWPWPGTVITRLPRRWPWRSSACSPVSAATASAPCSWPGRRSSISAGLHGPTARVCGHTLTTVLIEVGDLAAAERTCAAGLAGARDAGDLWSLGNLLEKMVVLDLLSGRYADAAVHLREALQTALRTGVRSKALEDLDCCGYLCAWTGRPAEAVTVWAAVVALGARGVLGPVASGSARGLVPAAGTPARSPAGARTGSDAGGRGTRRGDEPGHRGRVRSHAHRCGPRAAGPRHRAWKRSAPGNGSWSPWSPGGTPMRRSPASCTSACARSARTWTASAIRPDAGAAPTSPAWPSAPGLV